MFSLGLEITLDVAIWVECLFRIKMVDPEEVALIGKELPCMMSWWLLLRWVLPNTSQALLLPFLKIWDGTQSMTVLLRQATMATKKVVLLYSTPVTATLHSLNSVMLQLRVAFHIVAATTLAKLYVLLRVTWWQMVVLCTVNTSVVSILLVQILAIIKQNLCKCLEHLLSVYQVRWVKMYFQVHFKVDAIRTYATQITVSHSRLDLTL